MVSNKEINEKFQSKKNSDQSFCPECGTKNKAKSEFCQECGTKIPKIASNSVTTKMSKDSANGFIEKLNLWWNNRNKNEKIITGVGACCLGIIIIGLIGAALPQEDLTVLVLNDIDSNTIYPEVKINNDTTEYVIKGHTEPNATVYVNGGKVDLDSKNQFSYKVTIPKGATEQKVTIEAKKEGKADNSIEVTFKRPTSSDTTSSDTTSSESESDQSTISEKPTEVTISQLYGSSIKEGTLVKVTGTVLESDGYNLRIENSDGQDILVQGWDLEAYEDQSVTVIGTFIGPTSYETVMGGSRTVPTLDDGKIE